MEYNSWALIIYMPIAMGYQYFVLGDVTGAFDVNYILAALLSVNTYLAIDEALEDYIRVLFSIAFLYNHNIIIFF